jgi:hypothetical protein
MPQMPIAAPPIRKIYAVIYYCFYICYVAYCNAFSILTTQIFFLNSQPLIE